MPSKLTCVPGSQGPRQSGSVATAISTVSVEASWVEVSSLGLLWAWALELSAYKKKTMSLFARTIFCLRY